MRDPHRPQHQRADKTELNGDGKSLIVRIDRRHRARAGPAGRKLTELFGDRTGPVADDRSGSNDRQRSLQERNVRSKISRSICSTVLADFDEGIVYTFAQTW